MFQTYLQGHVTYPSPGSTIVNKRLWLLSKPLISLVDTIMHQFFFYIYIYTHIYRHIYHPYAKHWIHLIIHRVVSSNHPKWKEAFFGPFTVLERWRERGMRIFFLLKLRSKEDSTISPQTSLINSAFSKPVVSYLFLKNINDKKRALKSTSTLFSPVFLIGIGGEKVTLNNEIPCPISRVC